MLDSVTVCYVDFFTVSQYRYELMVTANFLWNVCCKK